MEHRLEGSGLDAGNIERKTGEAASGGCCHTGGMSRESGARSEWAGAYVRCPGGTGAPRD